jgi:hypothetical protein
MIPEHVEEKTCSKNININITFRVFPSFRTEEFVRKSESKGNVVRAGPAAGYQSIRTANYVDTVGLHRIRNISLGSTMSYAARATRLSCRPLRSFCRIERQNHRRTRDFSVRVVGRTHPCSNNDLSPRRTTESYDSRLSIFDKARSPRSWLRKINERF